MPSFAPFASSPLGSLAPPAAPPSPPTPTVISTAVGSLFVTTPRPVLAFATSLSGPWTAESHCYLNRLRRTLAPEIDMATANWFYGRVLDPGSSTFATKVPLDVVGQFVRVTIPNWWEAGTNNLGDWNADTNTPTLVSSTPTTGEGDYYTVSVAGTTSLDGVSPWEVGDVLVFRAGVWFRLEDFRWHGVVATSTLSADGRRDGVATGKQLLTCYGLLYLAERKQITSTVVESEPASAANYSVVNINRGLSFNQDERGEFAEHGNRSENELQPGLNNLGTWNANTNIPVLSDGSGTEGDYYLIDEAGTTLLDGISDWPLLGIIVFRDGAWTHGVNSSGYVFSYQERGANEWDADQAVKYLLTNHNPWPVTAVLDDASGNLDWLPKGGVDTDRRTIKAILDDLIQRQRGVGYWVEYDEANDQIVLKTCSFVDVPVAMPNGTTLDANPNQYSLDFEASFDVTVSEVNDTMNTKYHKVVVEGDWRTSTFTLHCNPSANELVPDWTAAEQQGLMDGASRESWYTSLLLGVKHKANDKARRQDKFANVFARFVLSDEWNLESRDPLDVSISERVFAKIDPFNANGLFDDADCETWIAGLTVLDHLPLRERYDYSSSNIDDESWQDTIDVSSPPPFLQPFSFALTNVPRIPTWEMLDKFDSDAEDAPDKRKWYVNTHAHHDRPAISLDVSSGHQQFIAETEWTNIGATNLGNWNANTNLPALSDGSGTEGEFYTVTVAGTTTLDGVTDWKIGDVLHFHSGTWRRTPAVAHAEAQPTQSKNHAIDFSSVWVTLTAEMSEKASIARQIVLPSDGEAERVLRIPVRDCRLDYVVPNTVVGIKAGVLQQTTGGFVRDDRERLDTFAKAAAEWYGKQRQTLQIGYKQVRPIVELGWLIVDIGPSYQKTGINSIVTSVEFDLINSSTEFQTAFAELDFV